MEWQKVESQGQTFFLFCTSADFPLMLVLDQVEGFQKSLVLASLPAVVLVVCPVLASPFEAAKSSVLLVFGALACWLVRGTWKKRLDLAPPGVNLRHSILLVCLGAWATALLIATEHAHGWVVGWRPFAEIASGIGVAAAMMRFSVSRRALVGLIATTSLVLSFVVLLGFCGFDLPSYVETRRLRGGCGARGPWAIPCLSLRF